jgi:hypothetical protein
MRYVPAEDGMELKTAEVLRGDFWKLSRYCDRKFALALWRSSKNLEIFSSDVLEIVEHKSMPRRAASVKVFLGDLRRLLYFAPVPTSV